MNKKPSIFLKRLNWLVFGGLVTLGSVVIIRAVVQHRDQSVGFSGSRPIPRAIEQMEESLPQLSDTVIASSIETNMMLVRGGTFQMGCLEKNECWDATLPVHQVRIQSFRINRFEVSLAEWGAIMGSLPNKTLDAACEKCPVSNVSWDEVQGFLDRLNRLTGNQYGYRLPTESEWEFAARGGRQSSGFAFSGSADIEQVAWYIGNSGGKFSREEARLLERGQDREVRLRGARLNPVGSRKPNELQLYDMSGNAEELCQDHWHFDYKGAPRDGRAWLSEDSHFRVTRGGNWLAPADDCKVFERSFQFQNIASQRTGFRIARDEK